MSLNIVTRCVSSISPRVLKSRADTFELQSDIESVESGCPRFSLGCYITLKSTLSGGERERERGREREREREG